MQVADQVQAGDVVLYSGFRYSEVKGLELKPLAFPRLVSHVGKVRNVIDYYSTRGDVTTHEGVGILFDDGSNYPAADCRILFRVTSN
jgi:hypothetical protein